MFRKKGGHHGHSGHVMNVAQGITSMAMSLPWRANSDELPTIIIQPPQGGPWEGRQFTVSAGRVQYALTWLIAHSPAYRDVRLDITRLRELRAESSPEVDLMGNFLSIAGPEDGDNDSDEEQEAEAAERRDYRGVGVPGGNDADEVDDPVDAAGRGMRPPREPSESFIASDGLGGQSEEEMAGGTLEELAGNRDTPEAAKRINHPQRQEPLSEYNTPNLASVCFPCLFPDASGDPFVHCRARKVSFADGVKHLMRFADRPVGTSPHSTGLQVTARSVTGAST